MTKNVIQSNLMILLYSGENETRGYGHLLYWIPEFLKFGIEFGVLVRNMQLYRKIKNILKINNVFYAKDGLDIEKILLRFKKLHSIFYMSNHPANIHVLRYNEYRHIFIGSKNYTRDSKVSKVLRAYDELWLDSQACIDKIAKEMDVNNLKFHLIGKVHFKKLIENFEKRRTITCVFKDIEMFILMRIIQHLIEYVLQNNLSRNFVVTKSNQKKPFLKHFKEQLKEFLLIKGVKYQIYSSIADDFIIQSQCIICDLESYNQSFLASGVPIYVYRPENIAIETFFAGQCISLDGLYVFSCLEEFLEYFLGEDVKKEVRKKFAEYWIGKSHIVNNDFQKMLAGESL